MKVQDAKVITNGEEVQIFINCEVSVSKNEYRLTCLDSKNPIVVYKILGDNVIKYESKIGQDVVFEEHTVYFQE